ncbi:hypothetical protein JM93_01352 [Roseibium hamelinense]|uniref:Flagellin-like hook-associated protein FlgL n=1 Tax=Roseibium hamelinense TaxID=150831 RepID=A0A562T9N3_9HYPH|nr:flagellar protein [Roseibium hamelinense]MTI45267.1 flagellar protein [Roseibium hamelinense]TWI90371.1 hypothetical protein JM93_01352 [Roseibium hamelinense]
MPIDSITTSRTYLSQQLVGLNRTMDEKTTQLATGKVAPTFGGVGDNRILDLELTQRVDRISSFEQTIVSANLHINTMDVTLDRLENIRIDSKSALDPNSFDLQNNGKTRTQATAELLLFETVNLLNSEVAGYFLYGGTDATSNPVQAVEAILNGSDGLSGLSDVIDEYIQANLGANNNGRLDVSALVTNFAGAVPTDSTFTISEDGIHDFGFDIASVASTLSNTTITGPGGGDPDSFDIQLTGQPVLGETIDISFTLPPTNTETYTLSLTAATSDAVEGTFAIGADLEETATNLRAKIISELETEAQTSLKAIAADWAADEFFDTFNGAEPQRIDGPPYDTATARVAGGSTTLSWYTGENSTTTNPRNDKSAIIDTNLTVNYGARANEQGLADLVKSLATFVSADFSAGASIDEQYHQALTTKMRSVLEPDTATQSGIADIATEVAIVQRTVKQTNDRHLQMKSTYQTTIDEIEGVDNEVLAVEILQLQTNIEASYRATSLVLNLNLADFL